MRCHRAGEGSAGSASAVSGASFCYHCSTAVRNAASFIMRVSTSARRAADRCRARTSPAGRRVIGVHAMHSRSEANHGAQAP